MPERFRIEEKVPKSGSKYFLWDEPDEGGSQITRYILQYRDNPKMDWTRLADNIAASQTEYPFYSTIKVTPTTEFRLAAENKLGLGKWAVAKLDVPSSSSSSNKTVAIIVSVCVIVALILVAVTVLLGRQLKIFCEFLILSWVF